MGQITTDQTNEISSALRCRLSEAEPPTRSTPRRRTATCSCKASLRTSCSRRNRPARVCSAARASPASSSPGRGVSSGRGGAGSRRRALKIAFDHHLRPVSSPLTAAGTASTPQQREARPHDQVALVALPLLAHPIRGWSSSVPTDQPCSRWADQVDHPGPTCCAPGVGNRVGLDRDWIRGPFDA